MKKTTKRNKEINRKAKRITRSNDKKKRQENKQILQNKKNK